MHLSKVKFFKIAFYFFKFSGIATMTFQLKLINNNKIKSITFLPSRRGIAYNVFLMCLHVPATYFSVKTAYENDFSFERPFDVVIDSIRAVFAVVSVIFILAVFSARQTEVMDLAGELLHVDATTLYFDKSTISRGNNQSLESKITREIFLSNAIAFLAMFLTTRYYGVSSALYFLTTYWCDVIIQAVLMEFAAVLKLIEHLYGKLNANFSHVASESSLRRGETTMISTLTTRSYELSAEYRIARCVELEELHSTLFRISERIADFYSHSILLAIAYMFFSLTLYAYFLIRNLISDGVVFDLLATVNCLGVMIHRIVSLVTLTKAARSAVDESRMTGRLVHRWLRNSRNQQIKQELNQFSNYLLHQNLQFTVAGLFVLDGSLLVSIAGSITTYMMILLQFRNNNTATRA